MSYLEGWTELEAVGIGTTYKTKDGLLPARMALATPDTMEAVYKARDAIAATGGKLLITDMYRSYDVQRQAYLEYVASVKAGHPIAKRSPPGSSLHNSGRAIDLSLDDALKHLTLEKLWELMAPIGWVPIIEKPDTGVSEAWHFEVRGNFKPLHTLGYAVMVRAAICDIRGMTSDTQATTDRAHLQYQLMRTGRTPITSTLQGALSPEEMTAMKKAGDELWTADMVPLDPDSPRAVADLLAKEKVGLCAWVTA